MSNWKLSWAIARKILYRNKSRSARPAVFISMAGVALGLIVMLFAIAVTDGYKKSIRDKIVGMGAHIRISKYDQNYSFEQIPFTRNQFFIPDLEANPDIVKLQYFGTKAGIVKTDNQVEGIVLKGIDTSFNWPVFKPALVEGQLFDLSQPEASDEIIISVRLAKKLQLKTGDKLRAYFVQNPPMQRNFTIAGLYETGMPEYDNQVVLADLRHVQKLNGWDSSQVGAIELFIRDYETVDRMGIWVDEAIGYEMRAETVTQLFPEIFEWVALFDTNVLVLLIITILVSAVTMLSTFFIIVLEQTRKIGLLKALGMSSSQTVTVFLMVAARILLTGMVIGNSIALIICFLQHNYKIIKLNPEIYYVDYIPVLINGWSFVAVNIGVVTVCMAMLLFPAFAFTRKMTAVSALRWE
ncbi:MAG: ABC transporter permease [Bacteroidales bacterium]|jgi:lipoprotein-releasing system permease protein|nr:ABC transporter permease [Bacteroidales bacterium]